MLDLTPQFHDILIQLWLPTEDESGKIQLETKNAPFVVSGGQGDTVRIVPSPYGPTQQTEREPREQREAHDRITVSHNLTQTIKKR